MLDSILRDKFIYGMSNGPILDRLCEEEHTKTINEILDIALKKEASMKQIAIVADINKFKATRGCLSYQNKSRSQGNHKHQLRKVTNNMNKTSNCFAYGKNNHNYNNCKYRVSRK